MENKTAGPRLTGSKKKYLRFRNGLNQSLDSSQIETLFHDLKQTVRAGKHPSVAE